MLTRPLVGAGFLPANGIENTGRHGALRDFGLTRRERDVLALLCLRLTDREIGDHLVIGIRTVHTHVSRILEKLGVANRREAAAVAWRLDAACAMGFEAPLGTRSAPRRMRRRSLT